MCPIFLLTVISRHLPHAIHHSNVLWSSWVDQRNSSLFRSVLPSENWNCAGWRGTGGRRESKIVARKVHTHTGAKIGFEGGRERSIRERGRFKREVVSRERERVRFKREVVSREGRRLIRKPHDFCRNVYLIRAHLRNADKPHHHRSSCFAWTVRKNARTHPQALWGVIAISTHSKRHVHHNQHINRYVRMKDLHYSFRIFSLCSFNPPNSRLDVFLFALWLLSSYSWCNTHTFLFMYSTLPHQNVEVSNQRARMRGAMPILWLAPCQVEQLRWLEWYIQWVNETCLALMN